MTPFPHTIDIGAPLTEAWEVMSLHELRHLPVTENGELVGLVTGRDIGLTLDTKLGTPDASGLTVRDVYEPEVFVVDLETPVDKVARYMAEHHLGSAMVVKNGKLAGIFTVTDACRLLARTLEDLPPAGGGDAA